MEKYDRMKLNNRARSILLIAVLIIAFLSIYTIAFQWYFGPPSKPDIHYQYSDKGQREFMKKIVSSLEDDNAAKYYLRASLEMTPVSESSSFYDSWPEVPEDASPETISEFEDYISAHEPVYALFQQGLKQERFFLPADDILEGDFNLTNFTRLARLVEAKGRLYAHKGRLKEAMETYLDQLRFSADVYDNNPMSKALGGVACEYGAYRGLDSLLSRLDDEQMLEELLQTLVEIEEHRAPLSLTIRREHEDLMDSFGNHASLALYWGDPPIDPGPGDYFLDTVRRTAQYLLGSVGQWIVSIRADRSFRALIELSEEPYPVLLREPLEDRILTGMPAYRGAMFVLARRDAQRRGFIIKVALQLHKLHHGEYPESFNELSGIVPEEMLVDPLSTNRFIYQKTDDGYLFYSYGIDFDDDGGTPHGDRYNHKHREGDIVFEPPVAMKAEAQ
jgi:tetratricopeptide (TPR) repeat protein